MMRSIWLLALAASISLASSGVLAAQFELKEGPDDVEVLLDGKLFTRYVKQSAGRPILFPIFGPSGKPMTRDIEGEVKDHPHHRSLWFTHGDVNGVDFWSLGKGKTEHRELRKIAGGDKGVITAVVDWIAPDGKKVLEDERTYIFAVDGDARLIDVFFTLKATNGSVTFGDTKEGTFGVRVPNSVALNARQGGHIVTSEGLEDRRAWGKPAKWVDYHGPVDGETLGIAILNHPDSFNFPCRWHVRDYGLFAANPFGKKDFPRVEGTGGEHNLAAGDSLKLGYRVVLHQGTDRDAKIAERFSEFEKAPFEPATERQ